MGFACIVDGWRVVERSIDDEKRSQHGFTGELVRGFRTPKTEHFVEYRVRVHHVSESWVIHRRFEEFRQFNLQLLHCPQIPETKPLPPFPRRTLWSSMDPEFLDARLLALGDYLSDLCQDRVIGSSVILASFLMPDEDLQSKQSLISSDDVESFIGDGSIISFFLTMEEQAKHAGDAPARWYETRDAASASMQEHGYAGTTVSFFSSCATVPDSSCSTMAPRPAIMRAATPCRQRSIVSDSFVTKAAVVSDDIQSQEKSDNNPSNTYFSVLLGRLRALM